MGVSDEGKILFTRNIINNGKAPEKGREVMETHALEQT